MICVTEINGVLVENKIFTTKFCCDYESCKGACCNKPVEGVELLGGYLSPDEAAEILYSRNRLSVLVEDADEQLVKDYPVQKVDGEFYTSCRGDKCLFCHMGFGTCVLKEARKLKAADIDIPYSCNLYPLIHEESNGKQLLKLGHTFDKDYCKSAYEKGKRENVYLIDFLKDAIIRGFGEAFWNSLKEVQQDYL